MISSSTPSVDVQDDDDNEGSEEELFQRVW